MNRDPPAKKASSGRRRRSLRKNAYVQSGRVGKGPGPIARSLAPPRTGRADFAQSFAVGVPHPALPEPVTSGSRRLPRPCPLPVSRAPVGRAGASNRASGVMIGLSGRGEPAQGKAPDAGDASQASPKQAGACLCAMPACWPAGRTQTGSMTPSHAGRTGQESREMLELRPFGGRYERWLRRRRWRMRRPRAKCSTCRKDCRAYPFPKSLAQPRSLSCQ